MSDDKDLFLWSPNSSSLTAVELSVDNLFLVARTESVGTSKDSLSELLPSLSSDDSGEQIMQNTQIELILVKNSAVLCIQRISQVQFLMQQQNSTVTLICMCQCKYIMFSLSYVVKHVNFSGQPNIAIRLYHVICPKLIQLPPRIAATGHSFSEATHFNLTQYEWTQLSKYKEEKLTPPGFEPRFKDKSMLPT